MGDKDLFLQLVLYVQHPLRGIITLQPLSHEGEIVEKLVAVPRPAFILREHWPLHFGRVMREEEVNHDGDDEVGLFRLVQSRCPCRSVSPNTTNRG